MRWFGHLLSTFFCLGSFWMLWDLWDSESQGWHDTLAGDLVVFTDDRPGLPSGGRLS